MQWCSFSKQDTNINYSSQYTSEINKDQLMLANKVRKKRKTFTSVLGQKVIVRECAGIQSNYEQIKESVKLVMILTAQKYWILVTRN